MEIVENIKEKAPLFKESANSGSQGKIVYIIGHEPLAHNISVMILFTLVYGLCC
tara:strand:- start:79 stop:240 length:162 start_codon:yes stop_codon:yes gene_type:complete